MRERSVGDAPQGAKNLASPCGQKVRGDKKGEFICRTPQGWTRAQTTCVTSSTVNWQRRSRQANFKAQLKEQPWWSHQSISMEVKQGSYCMYEHCLGSTWKPGQQIKRQRKGYRTKYRCAERSIMTGEDVWLCNNTKTIAAGKYQQHLCHIKYHKKNQHLICVAAALCLLLLKPPLLLPRNLPQQLLQIQSVRFNPSSNQIRTKRIGRNKLDKYFIRTNLSTTTTAAAALLL